MVERDDSLLREVDEDLRREEMAKLWEKYGAFAMAGAVAIVLGFGGWKWVESRRQAAAESDGASFAAAIKTLNENKTAEAEKALDAISKTGTAGYATLAQLRLAAAEAKAGKTPEAVAAYDQIAANRSVDPLLADFARLQAALLKSDTADWTEMQNRLSPLLSDQGAWRAPAREALGFAALKAGNTDAARGAFEKLIGDRSVPPSISERATMMMAVLTEQKLASETSAAPATPPPGGTQTPPKKN
jgi:hypothetical protein